MKNKTLIKIIGFGSIVKKFLQTKRKFFTRTKFEVYQRSNRDNQQFFSNVLFKNILSYIPDDNPTFYCCSINEETILRKSGSNFSRLQVALPNLKIMNDFINAGFFYRGIHFILTNPSDLLTEAIIQKSKNKKIYGLGLSMDRIRYNKIFSELNINIDHNQFDLVGNHWDSPIINFSNDTIHNNIDQLIALIALLKNKIKSEFCGYKPPIESGVQVICDTIYRLSNNEKLEVSGFIEDQNVVAAGILNSMTFEFKQPAVNPIANRLLQKAIGFHKTTYNSLIEKVS